MGTSWIISDTILVNSRIVATVFHILAIFLTAFRVWFRCRIGRFWWEDAWASLALFFDMLCLAALWINVDITHVTGLSDQSWRLQSISYFLTLPVCPCVTWSSRMSILFSVIRSTSPALTVRRIESVTVALFAAMGLGIVIANLYLCSEGVSQISPAGPGLPASSMPSGRPWPTPLIIIALGSDLISDGILVYLPLRLLWHIRLPKNQRRVILSIFTSSIITSLIGIAHAVFVSPSSSPPHGTIQDSGTHLRFGMIILPNFEASFSLATCDLLVVVTYLYRIFCKGENIETDHGHQPETGVNTPTINDFTSVDLNELCPQPSDIEINMSGLT